MLSVSSRSSVAGTSRIDFTPAQTTRIRVRLSVVRSADSSQVSRAPRCTPPRPPVANTAIPAAGGQVGGRGHRRRAVARPRGDRRQVAHAGLDDVGRLGDAASAPRRRGRSGPRRRRRRSSPGRRRLARTAASISRAIRALSGRGRPWLMIVLSSATTGAPARQGVGDLRIDPHCSDVGEVLDVRRLRRRTARSRPRHWVKRSVWRKFDSCASTESHSTSSTNRDGVSTPWVIRTDRQPGVSARISRARGTRRRSRASDPASTLMSATSSTMPPAWQIGAAGATDPSRAVRARRIPDPTSLICHTGHMRARRALICPAAVCAVWSVPSP